MHLNKYLSLSLSALNIPSHIFILFLFMLYMQLYMYREILKVICLYMYYVVSYTSRRSFCLYTDGTYGAGSQLLQIVAAEEATVASAVGESTRQTRTCSRPF